MLCAMLCAVLLGCVALAAGGNAKPPQVYVYLRYPPEHGVQNEIICHCTDFYPPKIGMRLLVNGENLNLCNQSDLTFKDDWSYYTTMNGKIMYKDGNTYTCEVEHNDGAVKKHVLDNPM